MAGGTEEVDLGPLSIMAPIMELDPQPRRGFSPRRALLHAGLAVLPFILLGTVFTALSKSAQGAAEVVSSATQDTLWAGLIAFFASYCFQLRLKKIGAVLVLVVAGIFATHAFVFARLSQMEPAPSPLTAAELRRPVLQGARFCHPALGFSFPALEARFGHDEEIEQRLRAQATDDTMTWWAYGDREAGTLLFVLVNKAIGQDEESFRGFMEGVRQATSESQNVSYGPVVDRWERGRGEYALQGQGDGFKLAFHCLARGAEEDLPPMAVCLQTITPDAEGDPLAPIRSGLALGC